MKVKISDIVVEELREGKDAFWAYIYPANTKEARAVEVEIKLPLPKLEWRVEQAVKLLKKHIERGASVGARGVLRMLETGE